MIMSIPEMLIMIAALAAGVMITRFVPFVLFPENRRVPKAVEYLGSVLPPAVIALLVVYCLRNVDFLHGSFGLPEILAILAVCGLHTWKRNSLLSIAGGTILYMVLIDLIG